MNNSQVFSACYLAGLILGGAWATQLPWWQAGIPAWAMLICASAPYMCGANVTRGYSRAVAFGLFFGAMSGAVAADFAEVADLLTWPGHDSAAAISAALGVGMCWALASVVTPMQPEDDARPGTVGTWLYIITCAIAYAPLVAEVWP